MGATFVYHQKERNMNISDAEEYASLPYRQQGLAGRVTYGFDKRYLIEANFGYKVRRISLRANALDSSPRSPADG